MHQRTGRRRACGGFVCLAAALVVLSGCGDEPAERDDRPVVVATVWPLANLARQIAGDRARVVSLVPPGRSPHGFQPTGRDAEALHDARLAVLVGLGFDDWAKEALHRLGGDKEAPLVFADAVGVEKTPRDSEDDHDHEHAHGPAGPNPHLWLDPVLTRRFVLILGERLAAMLPEAADPVEKRTEALAADLGRIDRAYRTGLSGFRGRGVVTFHNAFDRLFERYGLRTAATLTPVESPGAPTPRRVERALKVIEQKNVRTVFTEPQFPATATRSLREDGGVEVLTLDPLGNPHQPDRDTYQKMMRYNLRTLMKGMGGTE